jgi:hypothetical protein
MLAYLVIFLLVFAGLTSCTQPAQSESDRNSEVLAKENEQLKQENERLKQEQLSARIPEGQDAAASAAGSLSFLTSLKGKYPHDIQLLDNDVLKPRLQKMLGAQYDYLKSIWEVETPIEITNGMLYTWAMQAHSGGDPGAVLMADISRNVLYIAIRKDAKVNVYAEDGSAAPQRMQDWAEE